MSPDLITKKVATILALETTPEAQQAQLYERVGSIVLEAALNRLLLALSPEEVASIELYLDTHAETADIFEYLNTTYPAFETFIEEEVMALQLEIVSIMS